jgi:hypothetical protein
VEATEHLKSRGVFDRMDEIVWAHEDDPTSAGMALGQQLAVDRAPFFIVRDDSGETVYTSVLQLIRERLGQTVTVQEQAASIDVDDVGGI